MPRYNITFTASVGDARPVNSRVWASTDEEAIAGAISRLAAMRALYRSCRTLDEWEVWQGVPPYTPHKTVAAGRMAARS